jgi:hypothetical protein
MDVYCECFVLLGRGPCDELITRPEESYRLWCVAVCDLETSWMRRPWPTGGCRAKIKQTNKPIVQGRSGQVRKIWPPTGIRSPDRPARSQSLYRVSYPARALKPYQESEYIFHSPLERKVRFLSLAAQYICVNYAEPLLLSMNKSEVPFLQEKTRPGEYIRGVINGHGEWRHVVLNCT